VAEVAKGIIDVEINTGSSSSELKALLAQINAFSLALNKANATQGKFAAEYTKKLQNAINATGSFTAETIRLQTAAATLDKTLSKGKTSLGQYFSSRFNKDGAMAAETLALAGERARRLQTQFIATSAASNGFQDALAVRPLAAFSSEAAIAAQKTQILSSMFKQGTTQLINFGKNVQWAGRQLMVGFTVPLTIFGAVAGKTFMELEKQVVGFKKVYGDLFTTPAELNENLEAVKGLASEYTKYGIAVKDTIGLAAQAAAAGRQGAELADSVTQSTRLATLGQMDQNAALETTISLQSAFKLSGQDLADTINFLNMVENQTVVSLQDIAAAIPRVAPVISGLGGDVKDLTVFLAAMQEGGVDAAEGANALKSGLASLINPTKQATAMLSGMGINLDSIIQMNKGDLMGTVQSFAQALGALDQFSRQQALEQVFGKFQYAKLGALFENISREGSQAQQVIATLGYTTEQLASTADKELKTIEESFGVQLTGAIERFKLAIAPIGEIFVKMAIPLVNFATTIAEAFNGLSDGQKKFAAIGAVIIGVVVPAVTMLTGLFLNLVGTLAKMTQGVSLFAMGFIKGGPIGAVKALTQSSKYLSLAEMDAAMAAQQLAGSSAILNKTLVEQAIQGNAAAAAIGNLTKAYAGMIATQSAAAGTFPAQFGVAGAAAKGAKASQVVIRGVQRRNAGGPIFMSNGTTVPGSGNTDTVPAMLTPGEFVVNKEATKNNLGLLYSINNSKSSQRLNAGGKAKGMQYFDSGDFVFPTELSDADILRLDAFDDEITEIDRANRRDENRRVVRRSQLDSARLRNNPNEVFNDNNRGNRTNTTFAHMQNPVVGVASRAGEFKGGIPLINGPDAVQYIEDLYNSDPDSFSTQQKSYFAAGRLNDFRGWSIHGNLGFDISSYLNAGTNNIQDLISDLNLRRRLGLNPYETMLKAIGVSTPMEMASISDEIHRDVIARLKALHRRGHTTYVDTDLYPHMERVVPRAIRRAVVGTDLDPSIVRRLFDPEVSFAGLRARGPGARELEDLVKSGDISQEEVIDRVSQSTGKTKKSLMLNEYKGLATPVTASGTRIAVVNRSAGRREMVERLATMSAQVLSRRRIPGYNAGALVGQSLRRRVRPGKEERLAQQSALHNFAFDSRNVRETPAMDTILGMMKPLTQKTRATRGTVLGSTRNKELPYAQQKRIVAAIKEGRYEDLFGMKLNFKGGAGSYTTKRDLDFSPFIGDLSNPTLKDFSYGFMGLDTQKKDVDKIRKLIRSGKFKKLTPGTAEYARQLGMTGLWSPARSFRPGDNNPIGSDYSVEQVLAARLRDYNNTKKQLNTAFPDKKIQQLFIDEMVGSGVLALDMQKASYKHPVMSDRNNRVKKLRAKEHELLVGDRTSQITGVATDLRTKLPSLITQSGVQGFNRGNIVPGVGNTDTVPAMLTPGEFVVNKESTKKNYDLLTAINNSQKLNKGGMAYKGSREAPPRLAMNSGGAVQYFAVGGMVAGMAPMAAGLGASMLPMAMAPEMGMMQSIIASTVAFTAAQKSVKFALLKFQKVSLKAVDSTGKVGEGFTQLFPHLSKLSPKILKFAAPLSGAGVALAAVGFTLYKLNKSLVDTEKSGAELSNAMYGSAKTTKAMADAFGRETYATSARRKAVEKAGGQEITEEAVAASGEFMKSDAAKGIIEDIKLVEKSGGDAVLALRNQLASSIIAGVISPEEARAIALDIGKEIGDEKLAIKLSGELTSLIGPNGEKILDNLVEITAEIAPKINSSTIAKDAQEAFDSLNPGEKFVQFFKGGQDSFVENFSIDEISAKNASALAKEAEARALLNLAYQEGTITLKEYLDAEGKITSGSNERSKFVEDANIEAMGFGSKEELNESVKVYQGYLKLQDDLKKAREEGGLFAGGDISDEILAYEEKYGSKIDQGSSAYAGTVGKSRDTLRQSFVDSGMDEGMAQTRVDSLSRVSNVDPEIYDKILSGQMPLQGMDVLVRLEAAGNLTAEDIDRLGKELTAISTIPNVDKILDFNMSDEDQLTEIYDQYIALEEEPDIFKGVSIEDQFSDTMSQFGIEYAWLASLPNQEKIILLRNMETFEKYNSLAAAEKAATGGYVEAGTRRAQVTSAQSLKQNKETFGQAPVAEKPEKTSGGKGSQAEDRLKRLKDMLMERFRLQEMLIDKEAEGFNKRIKQISREIQLQQRQVALEEKQIEVRQKALEELSKKEDEVNTVYDNRISALDRVSASNSRLASQEQSRISLASALASGDIAGAASAMSNITQQSAETQIEDTRTALELQREEALKNLTVDVNGVLMTRKDIEASIETIQINIDKIQTSIYDKNILIQTEEDKLLKIEEKRLKVAENREKVETRMYLLEQKKDYDELNKKGTRKKLSAAEKAALAEYKTSYNNMATLYNQQNPDTPVQLLNRGGMVSGMGMRDTVPARLTPGEFVIRKNATKTFLPLLESINSGVFPSVGGMGLSSPKYNVPANNTTNVPVSQSISNSSNASTMYNNSYSINVNVSGSNSSADEIANVVMGKIARSNSGSIRGSRY
jgi:TP901 family phage tail tape measure protein